MRQLGRAAEADKYFEEVIASAKDMKQALVSLHYELATTAIKLGDWQKAIKNLEYYLKETNQPERTCIGCFELGISYACAGDNENALKYFNLALQRHKKRHRVRNVRSSKVPRICSKRRTFLLR